MTSPLLRSAAIAGLLVASLSGCSVIQNIFPAQAERDEETQEVESAGEADVFTMAVGDCLDDQDADTVETIPAVPCDQPHDFEAYYSYDLEDGDYPGIDEVEEQADQGCLTAFDTFVGVVYDNSTLNFTYFYPTDDSWASGDREIMCLIGDPAGKVTGTLAGAAR